MLYITILVVTVPAVAVRRAYLAEGSLPQDFEEVELARCCLVVALGHDV